MFEDIIAVDGSGFVLHDEAVSLIQDACSDHTDLCQFETIGRSEEGRPIAGIRMGNGPQRISLVSGAHSDEPVGSETLRRLILGLLAHADEYKHVLEACTFYVVPHVNPDGEIRNSGWITDWPDVGAYLRGAFRELPGRDVEFNYPARRVENKAVSKWLSAHGPFDLHMSLHGMGFSDGAMLLIERNWSYRTEHLQAQFVDAATKAGLRMHDHNRKGEKGFFHIAAGFTTSPEGAAMRTYFRSHGQDDVAALFGDSSMEYVRKLGGDPLCLVTELPLFIVEGEATPGHPTSYLDFKADLPHIRQQLSTGVGMDDWCARYGLKPLPIDHAVRLQLVALQLGIETISS